MTNTPLSDDQFLNLIKAGCFNDFIIHHIDKQPKEVIEYMIKNQKKIMKKIRRKLKKECVLEEKK